VVESSSRQVRIWAEVANADGRLFPGSSVTLTVYPVPQAPREGRTARVGP
jgi:hypothetical protein